MVTNKRSPFDAPNFDVFEPARLSDERGVIEGVRLDGPQSFVPWIGLTTIRELALKHADRTALVDQADYDLAMEEVESSRERIQELEDQLREAKAFQENLSGVAKQGFDIRKKQGPQVKPEAVSV